MPFFTPDSSSEIRKRNFRNVQIDVIGVSISNVAAPFLPVFLTRLGASNFQVGLLSSIPGVTGLLLAILVGRFLQTRRKIVPWYSLSRLMVISCYTLTGVLTLLIPKTAMVTSTLAIWAFASLPQSLQYLSTILAPLAGTWLSGYIGLGGALWLSAGLRLLGFFLFLLPERRSAAPCSPPKMSGVEE
jgi:hypothetical protein